MGWSDNIALAFHHLAQQRGLRIPQDVSVIGFDDHGAEFVDPPLATISGEWHQMGRAAANLALRIVSGELPMQQASHTIVEVPTCYIPRTSAAGGYGQVEFVVEDGVIVGKAVRQSMHAYLCSEKEYADFELVFEVKVGNMNSGVQIRSRTDPEAKHHGMSGPQADLDNGHGLSGRLYGEGTKFGWLESADRKPPAPHTYTRPNEWNTVRILAVGPRIQTWFNDEPVADLAHERLYKTHPRGVIGLQVHEIMNDQPAEVRWRNIKIREVVHNEP